MNPLRLSCKALLLAMTLALLSVPALAAPVMAEQRVLLLTPYAYGRPGLDSFMRVYVDTLARAGVRTENILVEYLNLNRNVNPGGRARLRELLLAQHQGQRLDLIVTVQQPALDFALAELQSLAPTAPMVTIDATSPDPASLGQHPMLLLPPPELTARSTLNQALLLFPDTEHLVVAVGASESDLKAKAKIAATIAELGLRLKVSYTDALSFDGMAKAVASTVPHTIILLAPLNRDRDGHTAGSLEMSLKLARAANAPTFAMYSIGIGNGPLGGTVQHVEQLAATMGTISAEVLAGTRASPPGITPLATSPTSMYDWQQLKRWGADWHRLPSDTLFVNRQPSLWEQHGTLMLGGVILILFLSAVSAYLLMQRRRLRVAEQRYRVLVEHAPEAIVVYDARSGRYVDANSKAETLFAASREELLQSAPERFYVDSQPDGLPALQTISSHAQRSLGGEKLVFERAVRALDGRCFPCEVSLVALPSATGSLLRAGFVDISERKAAELELTRHRDHLEQQVSERTAALSRAAEQADSANRAKSVFLANMSHELRTPLNSIIGFSQIMVESTSMFDEEKHNLAIINRSGHHLLALINDILELSKIEAGQSRLTVASVALGEMIGEVQDMVRLAASSKGVRLLVACPQLPPPVLVDGGKLRQVLINLMSNAVKFTEAGSVTLALAVRGDGRGELLLDFAVTDTGSGIAEGDQEQIFEPFVQAAGPHSQSGTGLGLAISRQFVRLLGGELLLQSQPGAGSTFRFSIPVRPDPFADTGAPAPQRAYPAEAVAAPAPAARLGPVELQALDAGARDALRRALQALDMRSVDALLGALDPGHASLVAAIVTMLAAHQYRELCELLDLSLSREA
jgi:two-component system sensor histidine kinase/response regulator